MIATILKLLAGPITSKVLDVLAHHDRQKTSRAQMRIEIEKAVVEGLQQLSEHQADLVRTELTGEHWLQRTWRPIVALSFSGIIVFYGLVVPVSVDWFGAPPVRIGDVLLEWIMQAVLICLGGYIGGSTVEKLAKILRPPH